MATLQQENARLLQQLKTLEGTPALTSEALAKKNLQRLQEIARDTRTQRQSMTDFESYVKWMSGSLSGYAKYIEAGSIAAGFARVLPIPYAGQASILTKFVSQGILSLNATSVAINRYMGSSQQFVSRVEALDPVRTNPQEVAALNRFADEQLGRDMQDVHQKLAGTADLSASSLSFLESVNHYVGSTDEYWNKTKAFISRGDAAKKDKSFLSESIAGLKNRTGAFNARLHQFSDSSRKAAPLIKSLGTYEELTRELSGSVTTAKR
ncbi:MAG: hypothetical protein CXR31_02110 [Geobacter sp.]|nr:MAG: hypothetical protein CXR31_02110 [Geobacter sp.]